MRAIRVADSRISRWVLVLVWMAIIFVLSSQSSLPRAPEDTLDVVLKKLAHFAEYAVLGALLLRSLTPSDSWLPIHASTRTRLAAVALAGMYALTDEVHQSFVPGRAPSPIDVGIDLAGAALGSTVVTLWRPSARKP